MRIDSPKIALVTGANRGIGLEVVRQLARKGFLVMLGSRNAKKGERQAKRLRDEGLATIMSLQLDVSNERSIEKAYRFIKKEFGRLDVLVNNAGIFIDSGSTLNAKLDTIRKTFEVNTLAAFRLSQLFLPLMIKNKYGRIVNVSSGMGQLDDMYGGSPGYRISKTALNAVTRIFAHEAKGKGVLVNSVCPGWVKTDMGGPEAELPVEKGADTIVWLATLPSKGPTGGFFRQRKRIPW